MASKINSRLKSDKARSGKPYDRPKESIFRRVASAVRDTIVPSWLLNVPWGTPSEEETVPAPTPVESEVLDENTEASKEPVVPKPSKRFRYAPDSSEVIDVTRSRTGLFSTSTVDDHLRGVDNNTSQVAPSCELEKKEPQLIINGDDHSENSEGTASTSGCSSLISSHVDKPDHHFPSLNLGGNALENLRKEFKGKAFQNKLKKDAGVSTENSFSSPCDRSASQNDLSLWSRDSNLSISMRNTLRPQSAFQSSRPSFSLTSFGGPSVTNSSLSAKEKVSSPFYEGKTTYGGASAYRRAQLSSLPYQSSRNLRSKITVKPSHSNEDFECMSSAAKRILHTLEKMSTPLTDVKKIPNMKKSPADISASFTPASQRYNSYLPLLRRIPLSTPYDKGPPVSTVTSASRVNLLKNISKLSKNSKMEIPVHERSTVSLDNTTQSPLREVETNKGVGGGGGGGKIRTRLNQHLHQSSKPSEVKEMPEEVHLPDIPLPITNLPNINFAPKDKPKVTVCEENHRPSTPKESVAFTFASPIDHSPPQIAIQAHHTISDTPFTFSSPLGVNDTTTTSVSTKSSSKKEKEESKTEEKEETELYTGSVNEFLKTLRDSNQKSAEKNNSVKENKSCFNTYKADKELLEPVDAGFGDKFKPEIGSWECTTCLVRNKPGTDKCASCKANKPGFADTQQSAAPSLASMFKPAPGTWECMTCLLRNEADRKKCVSCQAVKPGSTAPVEEVKPQITFVGFGDKFKPAPGSWECTSCLLRNKPSDLKCVSCETENPNAPKDSKRGASSLLKRKSEDAKNDKTSKGFLPAGTWECDTCVERNPVGQSKCLACETRKLSSDTTDSKTSSGFKFNFTATPSSTPFRFGSLVVSPANTTASSTFKFGDIPETSKQQNFVQFGSTALPATGSVTFPSAISVTLPSAVPTTLPAASVESKFNFSVPVAATEPSGIKFNFPSSSVSPKPSEGLFKSGTPTSKSDKELTPDSNSASCVTFGNLNTDQNKTVDHSKTLAPETPEVTAPKTEAETDVKPNTLTNVATTVQLPKPSPVFPSNTPPSLTSISKIPCATTTTSSLLPAGGFVFGGNSTSSQSQSTTTFQFGNKTDDIKTGSCAPASAQTTTVFTSSAASGSISSPSPFTFSSQNKQFAPAETTPVSVAADNHGMAQETSVGLQNTNTPVVSSSSTLSFPPSSVPTQPTNFIFGSSNVPAATSSPSLFKFPTTVTTASSTADSMPKNSGVFTFGVPSNTVNKETKPDFSFANTVSEEKPQALPQSQFMFNAFKPESSNPATTSTPAATSSPFRFGVTTTPAPASTGGFVFGGTKSDVTQSASSPFAFGTGTAATKPLSNTSFGGFSQNQPAVATTASVQPSFSFGIPSSNTVPAVSGGFNAPSSNPNSLFTFGAKTTQAAPNPGNNTGALVNPNPIFGSPANQSVFSNTSTLASFGKPPEQKQDAPEGFSFGSSASSTPVFRFGGSSQDGPQEKRHAAAPSPAGGFNFVPQANTMNNSMNFNPTTPPSFNFGSTLLPGTPLFQFNASSDPASGQSSGTRKIRKAVRRGLRKPD